MRLFLCYFVGDMVLRSLLSLTPYDSRWSDELHVELLPAPLPTPAELDRIAAGTDAGGHTSRAARFRESLASLGPYFWPIPANQTRAVLETPLDVGKYAIVWSVSRLKFVGILAGVDQGWPMFSPNVVTGDTMARLRLVFADGSSQIHRHCADPGDLTCYCHWFEEKRLQIALKIHRDRIVRSGYCRWLAAQHPANESGSPLVRIDVFKIRYEYPGPYDDARRFLAEQIGPPPRQQEPTFWVYDVATQTGRYVQ